ncbi:MAG: hypothetical protein JW929_11615 [Anaerolineales bacterium]|nr:hypothetical protein [Anaerolineales bacterium]
MNNPSDGIASRLRRRLYPPAAYALAAAACLGFALRSSASADPLPGGGRFPMDGRYRYTTFEAKMSATAEAKASATGAVFAAETAAALSTQTAEFEATQTANVPATATAGAEQTGTAAAESTRRAATAAAQTTKTAAAGATSTAAAQANATAGFRASAAAAAEATAFAIRQATEYVSLPATATAGAQATVAAEEQARRDAAWRDLPRIFTLKFFVLLASAILVELLMAFFLVRGVFDRIGIRSSKILLAVIPGNLAAVTAAWFGMWLLQTATPLPYAVGVLAAETFELFIEALWFRIILRLRFREAFLLSFSANLMSYAAGVALFGF